MSFTAKGRKERKRWTCFDIAPQRSRGPLSQENVKDEENELKGFGYDQREGFA